MWIFWEGLNIFLTQMEMSEPVSLFHFLISKAAEGLKDRICVEK